MANRHHSVVVIGGGAAGAGMAHRLVEQLRCQDVAVIEPAQMHYYQPMWTLVGAGVVERQTTARRMADVLPKQVRWIQERVLSVDPERQMVETEAGNRICYDWLIVAAGLKLDWEKIEGLSKELVGQAGICSNYSYETVAYTWQAISSFSGGAALFTMPMMPIKCSGAPQKIAYLAEDYFRRKGIRDRCTVHYLTTAPTIFGIKKYADALMEQVIRPRNIQVSFRHNLMAIRPKTREAVFQNLDSGETVVYKNTI